MKNRYSPSTGSFYPFDVEYPFLPADVIEVDQSVYTAAMSRPAGTVFVVVDGEAVVTEAPPAPYDPLPYLTTVRSDRERTLNRITGIAVATDDDKVRTACRVARQNLLDITSAPAVTGAKSMDDLRAAVEAAYSHIVDSVPVELRSAFD